MIWNILGYFCFLLCFFVPASAANTEEILLRLAQRARESQSDAILIVHNGRAIFEYRSDPYWQPIDALAITKSVVALTIGLLIDEGKITSIDTPVYQFYPEWEQGHKKSITIRHLLNQTSGLQADPMHEEIYNAYDTVQLALCAELSSIPGAYYQHNDKALCLLSGIVEKASGLSLSEYTNQRLFQPLGIENVSWQCDAAHHDYPIAHLGITAPDLAKIGDLVAKGGMWCGQRIVSQKWIDLIMTQGQSYNPFGAHLWWIDYYSVQCYWDDGLLKRYESAGIAPEYVQRLRALQGQVITIQDRVKNPTGDLFFSNTLMKYLGGPEKAREFYYHVVCKQLPPTLWTVSGARSFFTQGYFGQQLIVIPSKNVIAVRQARPKGSPDSSSIDTFADFGSIIDELIHCQGY